ncbi:MAG: DUF5317 domain-containing protein [Actinobacteria bacterium]|nr:DUF5317 domain-containing protein [Actinomycetota bacterium]MCG2806696.1 DUF5317 domain-containing protein [Coriobacteriia bacterium]
MTILLAAVTFGFGFGWATRGSIRGLESVDLRFGGAMLVAVSLLGIVPVLPLGILLQDPRWLVWFLWTPIAALTVFTALTNRRITGMLLVAAGVLANACVVVVNGGMPVLAANLPGAVTIEGLDAIAKSWLHVSATASTQLLVLADVIPIPGPQGLRGLASLGDILLALGVASALVKMMHANDSAVGSNTDGAA